MCVEYTQILCTVLHLVGGKAPYKPTHTSHPCVSWTRQNLRHWRWLRRLTLALGEEYTFRYQKVHKSAQIAAKLREPSLPLKKWSPPPQVMPEHLQKDDAIEAYRNYYIAEKASFATWKHGKAPFFMSP